MDPSVPPEVQEKIRELEKELNEGDITQQGFEKKKAKLLAPYLTSGVENGSTDVQRSSSPANYVRNVSTPTSTAYIQQPTAESRNRVALVQAALARQLENAEDEGLPMSSRRPNVASQPEPVVSPSLSFTEENGLVNSGSGSQGSTSSGHLPHPGLSSSPRASPPPTAPKTHSRPRPQHQLQPQPQQYHPQPQHHPQHHQGAGPGSAAARPPPPAYTSEWAQRGPETVLDDAPGPAVAPTHGSKGGVSHKIQQLLNTLKRPKKNRRPIEEYYQEEDTGAKQDDPNAPRPVGPSMQPAVGVPLESRQEWHRNLEAAILHHSTVLAKQPAISVVDTHGKVSVALTYGKLAGRAQKVAHYMLRKLGGGRAVKPGDRVALVFRPDEAPAFVSAFYGCIIAAVIPVCIEPPLTKEDPGGQQIGFLLGSLNITVALISEFMGKALPKEDGKDSIVHFKGWPRLTWFVTEHLPKPPKDWAPPQRPQPDTPAYIEYSSAKDGSALGVTVTRSALLTHCRSLTTACLYKDGETMVCTEDPKRSIGLWHGVMTAAYNGLHVVYVPPNVMSTLPTAWLHMIHKHKASCVVSSSRALSGSILLANHKDLKDVSLESVRMLLLDDGANPWSLASSDLFYDAYGPKGLAREALCPCAGSPETLTVSVRRPTASTSTGRGVMSISGLSYGVVRVEEPGSITSLTLQDVGIVMPGARIVVVKTNGPPILCKTDEIGEICVQSTATGGAYWGLQGKTAHTFKVQPLDERETPVTTGVYVRSGLLGFVGTGGLVFICGTMDGLIQIGARRHNTEDLIATVMAVEPHSFVYKGRIAVFSVTVLREERVVVVAEQKPNCTDEEAHTWMNSVVPAVESIHGVNLYGLVLVSSNTLPRGASGLVQVHETKQNFIEGTLHPVNLLMCPAQCVTNLPVPKPHTMVTGAAQLMGDLVTGRIAEATGLAYNAPYDDGDGAGKFQFLSEVLRWRAQTQPDSPLFSLLDNRGHVARAMNCSQLHKRAERIAALITEKLKLNSGDHLALLYPPGLELVCAFFGCLYVGVVPIVIRPPTLSNMLASVPTIKITLQISNARAILTCNSVLRIIKSKEIAPVLDVRSLPPMTPTDEVVKKKFEKFYKAPTAELIAYLDFSVSTTGILNGVKVSHSSVMNMCRSHKQISELYPSREVALCLDPFSGFGLVLWILSGVYSGHHTYLISPYELEVNPLLWLHIISSHKIRDTYVSYATIDLCCRELGSNTEILKNRGIDLSCVRTCTVVGEERPRVSLLTSFSALFSALRLPPHAVSAAFGCRVNPMLCLQGPQHPEPSTVYVDQRALRVDRLTLLERGAPNSLCLTESGKILPDVKVAIVHPDSKVPCAHTDLGEIWVSSPHNASGYYGLKEEINDALSKEHFQATVSGAGDTSIVYARTGYLGFMIKAEDNAKSKGLDSLYVVGALDEALNIRGFRYHPGDIESTVVRCHKNVIGSAVFTYNKLLVVIAELQGEEKDALDVVPVIITALLEEHQVVAGIVVVVDPNTIPINSRGEKQRVHLRDTFLADELDPIFAAYNL